MCQRYGRCLEFHKCQGQQHEGGWLHNVQVESKSPHWLDVAQPVIFEIREKKSKPASGELAG